MTDKKSKTNFQKLYARVARTYDLFYGPLLLHGLKKAINAMDVGPHMSVLEVAIGTGLSLNYYPRQAHIVGIDISKEMLSEAEEKVKKLDLHKVELKVMSAEKLEYPDNSFDRVFAPSAMSVIDRPEKAFDEMIRICKPDGVICVVSHFAGQRGVDRLVDRALNPLSSRFFGFRTTTSRDFIEKNPKAQVILKRDTLPMNFSTIYLLKKI
jgi:phosphatidylethanolamine/phosphatidyl-N-methylethanolamine N-methyltransferase